MTKEEKRTTPKGSSGSGSRGTGMRAVLQKEYMQGLDHLRQVIANVEHEIDKQKLEFYCCEANDEEKYEEYLRTCNSKLLQCNNHLRKKNLQLEVIDSELQLVALLNNARIAHAESDSISFLTEFWENLKNSMEGLRRLRGKLQTNVVERLKSNCRSYNYGNANLDLSEHYARDITKYQAEIGRMLEDTEILIKSFESNIRQDLFMNSNFSERVLISCDHKAFPILRLTPDVIEKLERICRLSKQWIDRDETYVYEINTHIREARNRTRKTREDLRSHQEKQKKIVKNAKSSLILFQSNKEKLRQIEAELKDLESQVGHFSHQKDGKTGEKRQKESMMDFLKISISQTKKNYALQRRRTRIQQQLSELERQLQEIELSLKSVQEAVAQKSQEKVVVVEKVETSEKVYSSIRVELDSFTANISKLQVQMSELTEQLGQLEMIQTLKTSPEMVDDFYDRPSSVKLAPSLREKIKRKRKILSQSI
ncbi:citron Rho-interacting kinase [Lingula anatina]|uniref:Citron Rho-interacting kinase n=1 Tax=Lingula anatina TaxID=7574 RepID=A0A1S3H8B0_LINAN|nr:citron Rho-interacting kinase [Lingula anatina]XP_013382221.1 citron Rho-interacting kinase [Lingula anatina]XP_013382222.1 citron Rho-interacting kinase [Lingula anatina]|eukprot:XP_013382220.1 citron Rho-interacting kinase [Lingula anatina]